MKKMVLLLIRVGAFGMLLIGMAVRGAELKDEFYQDFRSPKFPPPAILDIAATEGEQKVARREPGGLRILISGKPSGFPPWGVSPRFHVGGDFEITASYELIKLDKPTSGYGHSVTLWAMVGTPSVDAVGISRGNRPWDGNGWNANKGWWQVDEKKYHNDGQAFPTQCKSGQLRLVRTGSVVHFQASEGDSPEFQELRQVDYSTEDLTQIHLGVDTGGSEGPVEVLLKDIRIRAEELPLSGATRKPKGWSWLIWLVASVAGTGVLAVIAALIVWRFARDKSAARKLAEAPPRPRKVKP